MTTKANENEQARFPHGTVWSPADKENCVVYTLADGNCVIAENHCWIPGCYTPGAVHPAFRLSPEQAAKLATSFGDKPITRDAVLNELGQSAQDPALVEVFLAQQTELAADGLPKRVIYAMLDGSCKITENDYLIPGCYSPDASHEALRLTLGQAKALATSFGNKPITRDAVLNALNATEEARKKKAAPAKKTKLPAYYRDLTMGKEVLGTCRVCNSEIDIELGTCPTCKNKTAWLVGYEGDIVDGALVSWGSAAVILDGRLLNTVSRVSAPINERVTENIVWLPRPQSIDALWCNSPLIVFQLHNSCGLGPQHNLNRLGPQHNENAIAFLGTNPYTTFIYRSLVEFNKDRAKLSASLFELAARTTNKNLDDSRQKILDACLVLDPKSKALTQEAENNEVQQTEADVVNYPCERCGGHGVLVGAENTQHTCNRCKGYCDDPVFEMGRRCGIAAERERIMHIFSEYTENIRKEIRLILKSGLTKT